MSCSFAPERKRQAEACDPESTQGVPAPGLSSHLVCGSDALIFFVVDSGLERGPALYV